MPAIAYGEGDSALRRTRITAVLSAALLASALAVIAAPTAQADDFDNLYSEQVCNENWGGSSFKFHIWYNSGQNGSFRNIGSSVYDFNALRPGDGHAYPLKFCNFGASSPWPGSGQNIKNNAASGENDHYKYTARVFFYSGYKGAQDVMAPYQHIDQFRNVYNNNASFQWTS
ncbi:hypothetical protein [Streptomyces lasalocidi]|uniref:Uncharacterized protein n=1 Tax=Streptomyces lasalocidi TaxID=324833 RepID=A0A4U5WNT3_STRLS|nr:hypothetical protein [Streptomyces lasalocidi]TKT03590.1 hypothetical protein E4U91_28265 [Streptomyces lasalocidi]